MEGAALTDTAARGACTTPRRGPSFHIASSASPRLRGEQGPQVTELGGGRPGGPTVTNRVFKDGTRDGAKQKNEN